MKARLHNAAEAELADAFLYYLSAAGSRTAEAFLLEFQRVVERTVSHPEASPPLDAELRQIVFPRFPYSLIYARRGDDIVVLAVAHHRRRPGYWSERSPD